MVTVCEQEEMRVELLKKHIPKLFDIEGSLLYVGGGPGKLQLLNHLPNLEVTLLEISMMNIMGLELDGLAGKVHGDVRNAQDLFEYKEFDVSIWWHGPEHLYYSDIQGTIYNLCYVTKGLVVLGAPYGYYPQDAHDGNIFERHLSHLLPCDFTRWGLKQATVGVMESGPASCMIGWLDE